MDRPAAEGTPPRRDPEPASRPGHVELDIDIGRRIMVVANLLLTPEATAASSWAEAGVARALSTWEGPGLVVVAGNLFDLDTGPDGDPTRDVARALDTHPALRTALRDFAAGADRSVVCLVGRADADLAGAAAIRRPLEELGVLVAHSLDLQLMTAVGTRRVRVDPGSGVDTSVVPCLPLVADPTAPWQEGIGRLSEPAHVQRFLTSRLLYRRFARLAWWLLVPFALVVLLRLPVTEAVLDHLMDGHPLPQRAVGHLAAASWNGRLLAAALVSVVGLVVLAVVLGVISRKAWGAMGGGALIGPAEDAMGDSGATANDAARDAARRLQTEGFAGLVTGATLQAELTHLAGGFFASPGVSGEVVEEQAGRLGLPPVFLTQRQLAWIEIETGAELHTRLLMARTGVAPPTLLERLAARRRMVHDPHPVVVAAAPRGASWPAPPDLSAVRRRSRRSRRLAGAAIALTGLVDLLSALTPPLRERLHLVGDVLPLPASQTAGALVAITGVALLALARGVRRGQHRAWIISVALLGLTLFLHLARGADVGAWLITAVVLTFLVVNRGEFTAASDRPSLRSAALALGLGVAGITVLATLVVEASLHIDRDGTTAVSWRRAGQAVVERLVGVQHVPLPRHLNDFLAPALLAVGVGLALLTVVLATRPVVDRRRSSGRLAELRARDIVARHGQGTLDYFALRTEKHWFFHRDSLVAYAIYGGVCLVAPDPIGPRAEREQVWGAFRRFADGQGWAVAVVAAGEEWLATYRTTGMHEIYVGDEAVVDVQQFSLSGGQMKGLRQAFNRVAKYGYTASFHDPSRLDAATAGSLTGLMAQSRRGEFERGFSMMLGRIFNRRDEGLLLCVVTGPDGEPAAMCQFVPARGIRGYSLDLMRRDVGEHPNGIIDFALVSTINHLRQRGDHGLSLNFAALRSILDGERGDGVTQRVERWAVRRMSGFLQIETLWRFNAKYEPAWLPRYVVYDTPEFLVPAVLAMMRAESLWEVPLLGRVMAASDRRNAAGDPGAAPEVELPTGTGADLLPAPGPRSTA